MLFYLYSSRTNLTTDEENNWFKNKILLYKLYFYYLLSIIQAIINYSF